MEFNDNETNQNINVTSGNSFQSKEIGDHQYQRNSDLQLIEFYIKGGGNVKSVICSPCDNTGNQENKDNPMAQHVDQTTTQQQREYFIQNVENQVNNLKTSSGSLKNQNSKVAFTQSINWLNSNQLVVFDIMLGLKGSDIDVIETFEICILKMLDSIENVLKKSKNVYLGYIICSQTSVLATGVYRYYLSHPMDEKKSSRIVDLKEKIAMKLEAINYILDKLKENDVSINYFEQSLKIIESFNLALPDQQSFKPLMNFASGLGKMILTGGTSGLSEMFSGIKEGLSQAANKKIHEEQVDNFIMFVNLERIKYSIIKIMFDKTIDNANKDEQIKQTLQSIGKSIEKSSKWSNKYFFVQILSELILYQPQLDSASLQQLLTDLKFSYDMESEQLWDLLVKNNWVTQFKLEEGASEKTGFLNFSRSTLEEIDIDSIRLRDDLIKKQDKNKIKQKPKNKDSPAEIIQNFVLSLNLILKNFEPISSGLREYMLKGDQQFKGLMSYCFEGLEDQSSPQGVLKDAMADLFSGKDPLDIIEISIEKILNFAIDFFNQQFSNITKNSEAQLRVVFVSSLKDYSDDITNHIFTSNFKFESILDVNPTLKNFTSLYTQLDESLKGFVKKIQDYSTELFESLQKIQSITNSLQDQQNIINSVQNFLINQSQDFFNLVASDISGKITQIESIFEQIQKDLNLESFETKEQTTQLLNKSNSFVQQYDDILIQFEKIKVYYELIGNQSQNLTQPDTFLKLKLLLKKIQGADEKDPKLNKYKLLVRDMLKSDKFQQDIQNLIIQINDQVKLISQSIQQSLAKISLSIQNQPQDGAQEINSIQEMNSIQEINSIQDKIFYYMKMVNEFLKKASAQFESLRKDLEALENCNTLTHAQKWTQQVNDSLKQQILQQKDNLTRDSLKQFVIQQGDLIDSQDIQDEQESEFMNSCNIISNIFNDLSKLTTDIFQMITDTKKQFLNENPNQQDKMIGNLMMLMGNPLNELKSFMTGEMSQIKEKLVDDIQGVFKDFENNEFAKSIGGAISQLKSATSFVDLGGLASSLFEKFADQNWRIRDRIVLILFDLNRIFGGENGDQIYANTLIHMKAKDTSLKVQQTLKNEELLLEMRSILSTNWKSQEAEIKTYIQNHFKELDLQVEKMKTENANKDQMLKMYERSEAKLNQQLENISDIGQMAGIQLEFLKDLKKQLFKLSQDVEAIKKTLENLDDNMTLLKGKSVYQLFQDRKAYIFGKEKDNELNLKLKVCEYDNGEKKGSKKYKIIDEDDQSDSDEDNPLYTTNICEIEEFKDYFKEESEQVEEEKNDEQIEEIQVLPQENQEIQENQDEIEQDDQVNLNKQQIDINEEKKEEKESIQISSSQSFDTLDSLDSPEESFVSNYMKQTNTQPTIDQDQAPIVQQQEIQEIVQNQEVEQKQEEIIQIKKPKKKNIIDLFLDEYNKKNSLLLHGQIGSGSSRSAEQIEHYIWKQRRITRVKVLEMLRQSKSDNLRNAMENYSINGIFEIMEKKKLIDKKGYFLSKFIELESKLEDIKALDQIKDQGQKSEESEEESGSEEPEESSKSEEVIEEYELKDLQNPKSKAVFKTDFIDYMELEKEELCSAIYEILDECFQTTPIPLFIQIDKINDPKKLLSETLSQASQYNFSDQNIRQLTQLTKTGDIKLIFIINGYDKLKKEFFGLNLFSCNEFEEYRPPDDHKYLYPKVITTCSTNVLSGSYESNFQNIFKRRQRAKYFPEQFYVEYMIEDLNQKQIYNFLKQKFVVNLKGLLFETWFNQYYRDGWDVEITDKIIQDDFEKQFYSDIKQLIFKQKIYKQINIPDDFKKNVIDNLNKLMGDINQDGTFLNPFTNEQLKHFKMKLQLIVTKKLYQTIINEVQILSLLKTVKLLSTFVDVIDQVIIDTGSSKRMKQKIIDIITQEEIILGNKKISINDLINLLTKPVNFLENHFHQSQSMDFTCERILKMLNKNLYLKENQDLAQKLTILIAKALYDHEQTRYKFYNIFFRHFIKKQISEFKSEGLLIGNEVSMYKDCILFANRLATAFQREGIESFNYENQSQLYQVKSQWDEFFLDSEKQVRKQVRECLPLVCTGTQYSFLHSSVKDYILSKEFYKCVNSLQLTMKFLDQILQFKETQSKHANEEDPSKKKTGSAQKQAPIQQQNEKIVKQDQYSQQELIDIVLKQTQDTIKKEIMDTRESLKHEINETMKINIQELQKQIQQGDNQQAKQQESNKIQLFIESLVNNSQNFQDFVKFYKKFDKNIIQSNLHEKIQEIIKQIKIIIDLQLNQQPDLYNTKNSGICEFLFDKLNLELIESEKNQFMQNLLTIIKMAKVEKILQVPACNAIGLLIYSNRSFNKVDFSGLDLSKTNLYGGQFYRCIFNGCNMQRANLSYSIMYKCQFVNTNLSFAILRNCCLINCKFTNKTNFKRVNFMRPQDIDYHDKTDFKDRNTNILHKDLLVHVMVNPFDKNYLLAFHNYQVFIINIKDKNGKATQLKSFIHPFTRCGMIEFNYNDQICLIAGQQKSVVLLQLKNMQIIKTIKLQQINLITCINLNKIDNGILIGGINQETQQKFIELGNLETGYSKVLMDECDQLVIDEEKQMIICHADDKILHTTTVLCLNLKDYSQVGQKQYLLKKLGYVQDNQLQKNIKINKHHAIEHPTYENVHIEMIATEKPITDIQVFQNDGISINQNGVKKQNRAILDHIRILQKNVHKYGRHQKIILNPDLPKQLVVVSEQGLIQRFHFNNERFQNYELVQDTHQELNHIQFLINIHNQEKQFLTCYIKDHFTGIIKLRKFQFDAKKSQEGISRFKITEEYNLKTKSEHSLDGKQIVTRHQVLKMENHDSLQGEFILVIQENQGLIKKYILSESLYQINPSDFTNIQLKDLTKEGELFSSFEIHPKDHNVFCFLYNQEKQNQCPQSVIFDVLKNEQLAVLKFEMSPTLWKIQIDHHSNFNRMFLYNQLGQVKFYNDVGYSHKVDLDDGLKNHNRNSIFKKSKSVIIQPQHHLAEIIEPENESIFYDQIDEKQCADIIGFHSNSNFSQFLYFYDYLNHSFIQLDAQSKVKTILAVNSKQKFINKPISSEEKQRKTKKMPRCMKIDYLEIVKQKVNEYFKNNDSSLEQAVKDKNHEQILKQYRDQIQLTFHPILPYIFIIFKELKVIIVYSIDKKQIIQLIKIPLYFDKSVPFNMTIYNGNQNILICTYYQTVDIYLYRNNDKKKIEEFTNIYTKLFGKPKFLLDNSLFENCQMTMETLTVLKQNGASILQEKNQIVD